MEPPASLILAHETWSVSLNMALVIEEIWMSRNLKLFRYIEPDALKARQNIQTKFNEIVKVFSSAIQPPNELSNKTWSPPPYGCLKLNVDAVTRSLGSALAVVARKHLGEVLSIWAKKTPHLLPYNCRGWISLLGFKFSGQGGLEICNIWRRCKELFWSTHQPKLIPWMAYSQYYLQYL